MDGQRGRKRLIVPAPVGRIGTGLPDDEKQLLASLGPDAVMMMGDNPALPEMPERPTLLDFYRLRFGDITFRHLVQSAKHALDAGQDEKIVTACLLHDIANGALIRSDHGYWGAQLVAPYVEEEVAWAVRYHQALRYYPDESVGYRYPEAYLRFFGPDYVPPDYIRRDYEAARAHRWYMSARLVTIYDIYSFDARLDFDPEILADIIGRNFKQPKEGLGFDGSPVAHMWRTMIWPNNFL
ncbi:MAG TPA: HD domain-containing protein [Stellaceae bacterium]|nr:HD domain-containing protein [Stellaceae bacterium]